MSNRSFTYRLEDDYRIFHGKINGTSLSPGAMGDLQSGENLFTWYIKDAPHREYKIHIEQPLNIAGVISKITGESGAGRGVFRFEVQ